MGKTIRANLVFIYSLLSIMLICAITGVLRYSMDGLFEQYAKNEQKKMIDSIVAQVEDTFGQQTSETILYSVEVIANAALQNGNLVHIQLNNKELDWDIRTHREEECQIVLQHAENNMHSRYPGFQGKYMEENYDLKIQGTNVGYISIGYYGPYSLSDGELDLLNGLQNIIFVIGLVFLVITIFVSGLFAKRITRPISEAILVANRIADGEFGATIDETAKNEETAGLITAINEMSEKLAKQEMQKKQITSDVAHELRTPLTNLLGQTEAIIDGIWEPTEERMESFRQEIMRMVGIVNQLQQLYVLEANKSRITISNIDICKVIKSVADNFDIQIEKKKLHMKIIIQKDINMRGDEEKVIQCIYNLLSNAIRYSGENTEIIISAQCKDDNTEISITNYGAVIDEKDIPYLFERFYRADKSRSKATGGMGLGLAITKAIMDLHGGEIKVTSSSEEGTCFTLVFPTLE